MKRTTVYKKPSTPGSRTFNSRKEIDNLYDANWKRYRMIFLNVNKNCYCCPAKASIIDHVKRHSGNFSVFWDVANLIPLCKSCHDTATALFDRGNGPLAESLKQKQEWLKWRRAGNGIDFKVKVVPLGRELTSWVVGQKLARGII